MDEFLPHLRGEMWGTRRAIYGAGEMQVPIRLARCGGLALGRLSTAVGGAAFVRDDNFYSRYPTQANGGLNGAPNEFRGKEAFLRHLPPRRTRCGAPES